MQLSVIIPVYNCARYIDRCIESVLTQSFREIEVILVDDGSTDNSGDICEEWAKKDNRIRLIHQVNGGLSAARNKGIDHATSPYITFIDADDEVANDTFAPNMNILLKNSNIDLLEYPIDVHFGAPDAQTIKFSGALIENDIFRKWIALKGYQHCYACNKIYKTGLFNSLRFPVGESFEDAAICPEIIKKTSVLYLSEYGRYIYHSNGNGITHKYTFNNQEPLFRHNYRLLKEAIDRNYKESVAQLWLVSLNLLTDLRRCQDTDHRYITAASAYIESNRPPLDVICRSGFTFKECIKILTTVIIGATNLTKILSTNRSL